MTSDIDALTCAKVPCSPGSRLSFSWGPGTELRICEVSGPSGQGGVNPFKSTVVWSAPSPSHRALAHTVAPIQAALYQETADEGGHSAADAGNSPLVAFCQAVRQRLREERDALEAQAGANGGGGGAPGGEVVALEGAVWGLLELLYVGAPASEGFIAEDLAAWACEHSAAIDALAGVGRPLTQRLTDLLASARPDATEDYWPCLVHLVAVGRLDDALTLLGAHDAMAHPGALQALALQGPGGADAPPSAAMQQYEVLDALYVVLRQMPRFRRAYAGEEGARGAGTSGRAFDNMAEFLAYRGAWQAQCAGLPDACADLFAGAAAASPRTVEGVRAVLRVLAGDDAAAAAPCAHWVEWAVAHAVHAAPNLQAQAHLRGLLQAARAAVPYDGSTQFVLALLHDLLMAVAGGEPQGVVEVLAASGAVSPWFMSHIYDVLKAGAQGGQQGRGGLRGAGSVLERPLPLSGGDQAEYWRLLFAETLMPSGCSGSSAGWGLALAYLAWCPVHGADAAEALLECLPVGSRGGDERLLRKALTAATTHGLAAPATSLCRTAGAAAWYAGRIGAAARWLGGQGGARDVLRLSCALEPLGARAVAALSSCAGVYTAPLLPGLVDGDIAVLLEVLAGPAADGALASAQQARAELPPTLVVLRGLLAVQGAAQAAQQALVASDAAAHQAAGRALRDAVMGLFVESSGAAAAVLSPSKLPHGLVLPLLTYLLPLLEGTGPAALGPRAFSAGDIAALLGALTAAAAHAGEAPGGAHPRHAADVRLALARALARAHAWEAGAGGNNSGAEGGVRALPQPGVLSLMAA